MSSRDVSKEESGLHPSHDKPSEPPLCPSANLSFVAQYLNHDPDLWVFRRFGKLHLFNILCLQQRLAELENTLETKIWNYKATGLDELDEIDEIDEIDGLDELLLDIKVALKEYDDALSRQANYRSYRQPEKHIFNLLEKWWKDQSRGSALRIGLDFHTKGKKSHKDLASIAALEKTWTHRFIDSNDRLRRFFAKASTFSTPSTDDGIDKQLPSILFYSEENVQRAEAVFLHACFCCLLLCPILGLSYVHSKTWKLVILAVSLFATAVLTVGFLNAPNKNALALVAGYAAILVVFLSNGVGS